jgi:hypothetical protein
MSLSHIQLTINVAKDSTLFWILFMGLDRYIIH